MSASRHMTAAEEAAWEKLAQAARELRAVQAEAENLRRSKLKIHRPSVAADGKPKKGGPTRGQ